MSMGVKWKDDEEVSDIYTAKMERDRGQEDIINHKFFLLLC